MTRFHALNAANKHFKTGGSPTSPPSTFEAVTAAAGATRAKSLLLRKGRLERGDNAAPIYLPEITGRSGE